MFISINFLKKYSTEIFLVLVLLSMIVFSLPDLTTKPRLWYDEGINIEFAKNFLDFGKLDIVTAPGEFSRLTRFFQASGYPLSLPLSLFFGVFGFGPVQARVYMLGWMIMAVLSVFIFVKKLAGRESALAVAALIASFASFHDNGRTVMGEIPGFVFLLWALYFLLWNRAYLSAGVLFGLAISAKTSVYISVLPAILALLFLEKDNFWKNGLKIFAGMLPPFLLRIWFVMPDPFSIVSWKEVISLFQNPFGSAISSANYFLSNLAAIPKTYTILYFGLFTAVILFDYFKMGSWRAEKDPVYRKFFIFSLTYIFFAFLYYLKSPGWLRYLIAADLLTFILLVIALKNLSAEYLKKKIYFSIIVLGLIGFQIFYLFTPTPLKVWGFTGAKLYYSDSEEAVVNLVNTKFKNNTIGIFNVPEIAAFVPASRKYQAYRVVGLPFIGKNPALYSPPPEILILRSGEEATYFLTGEKEALEKNYQFLRTVGRYEIYKRIAG